MNSSNAITNNAVLDTVRPPFSAELDYPRFLRPKLSTPNLNYEVQLKLKFKCRVG